MGDIDESRSSSAITSSGTGNLSRNPRDLLQRFMESDKSKSVFEGAAKEEEEEEIELNLGLSLGGRFGIDKSPKKLMRSSSIAGSIPIVRDDDAVAPPPVVYPALMRTSSLPVETEEEWRKRKELQTLRRMEAKRRRSEKQRNLKGEKDSGGSLGEERREIELNLRGKIEREQPVGGYGPAASPFGFSSWDAAARQAILRGGFDVGMLKGKGNYVAGSGSQAFSPGSMESKGGSSSNMSELDSKPLQGGEASPVSIQTLQQQSSQEAVFSSGTKARENTSRTSGAEMETPSKRTNIAGGRGWEIGMNALEDMPCVFTKGDGPNGRRIEGILYKYGKGEEVRIMCVCHGSFLSPAEFVKHAGGSDVTHPLKHIVVNPNSSFL